MDRCRCDDYRAAVDKLRFYTMGTYRPDIIDNYKRSGFKINWVPNRINLCDLRFLRPRAMKILPPEQLPDGDLSPESLKLKNMWCPYMTPVTQE